jgi:hypothetical protein
LLGTPAIPGNFYLLNDPTFVYDIETTAVFVPPIEVCIPYDEPDPPIDETQIRLMHEEGSTYVDRTVSLDTENIIVCAEVSGFSGLVVAYEEAGPSYAPSAVASAFGSASVAGSGVFNELGLIIIPVVTVIGLRIWRRKR